MNMPNVISGPDLASLQRTFRDALLGQGAALSALIADGPQTDRGKRIAIYRDGYALRLVEALETDFPGLVALAGGQAFDVLARAYVAAHPSQHPSLRWFGRDLAAFLDATPPWNESPALAEMARFEWALGEAFDAPDGAPITAAAMVALPPEAWETLSFGPVASLRRLALSFEIVDAWQRRAEAGSHLRDAMTPAASPTTWVVWRHDLEVKYRALDADEATVLDGLIAGERFPALCDRLAIGSDEAQPVARAAGLLRAWVEAGMISSFQYGDVHDDHD